MPERPPITAAVTGAGGFLGRRITQLLCARGDRVRAVVRRPQPDLDALGATSIQLDIRDASAVRAALRDADVVFHAAAKTDHWGPAEEFRSVNVLGTRNVLEAARAGGVRCLVYTSTPSVVGYAHDVENGGPDLQCAAVHESPYPASKAEAERLVLDVNGGRLRTVALRPHLIIGPGDRRMMPRVVRRAAAGRLRIIGDGRNRVDLTDVDNAAWAHLDAADALGESDAACAGRAYFISNGEPVLLWEWLNRILAGLGLPPVTRSVPLGAARLAASTAELLWGSLRLEGEPPVTRFLAGALARSHWYDLEPARRDLDYHVRIPMEAATRRTVEWLAAHPDLDVPKRRGLITSIRVSSRRSHAPLSRWRRAGRGKELPDYYLVPTRDFTQFTRDFEEQYWSRDTAFNWGQSVEDNLRAHLLGLTEAEFLRLASLALPLVYRDLEQHIGLIEQEGMPLEQDALKAIAGSIPCGREAIREARAVHAPLERLELPIAELQDRLAILERQGLELREQRRLRLFRTEVGLKRLETETERRKQARHLALLAADAERVRRKLERSRREGRLERERLQSVIRVQLAVIAPRVLADLAETRDIVERTIAAGALPTDPVEREPLHDLVVKRQLRALTDIANHALVVEQSAIAPLTMGIIHYRRRREIQEAMTTFAHDEAKHSAVFRRFMAEKMGAKERIPEAVIKGGERYLWIARLMPSGAMFLAVIVEAIGGAFLEFFARNEHMPDPLFRGICRVIAERDEKRHQELCSATYNELYRTGSRWEHVRNRVALRELLRAAYGDKTEDHQLIQACRAFGLESDDLYRFVATRLSQQLETVGMCVPWDSLLAFLPRPAQRRSRER